MALSSFIHLKVHSAYSLAEGAIRIEELVEFCRAQNMPAIALTDTMNLFGTMAFSLAAVKAGIQPIIGAKVVVSNPVNTAINKYYQRTTADFDELVLLAATAAGYHNLVKLISRSYLGRTNGSVLHIPFESLIELNSGLLALSGRVKGGVSRFLAAGQTNKAKECLQKYQDVFQDRLYLELARFGLEGEIQLEDQIIGLAQQNNIPLVATNEAYFLTPEQYEAHDVLLCIASGSYVSQTERRRETPHHRLKTANEMGALFSDLPEAIMNTHHIAQRCSFILEPVAPKLPSFPTPKGEEQELFDQAHEGLSVRLTQQVLKSGMTENDQQTITQKYKERLDFEIGVINKMGYAGYFLIVADFIKEAKSRKIPVGPGRGSGAGSLVAWSLTITDVDPIAMGLYFERFLNPERISMPDFDIDFCQDRRDEVIHYVCEKYGKDRVAQIITFGKLQARIALRDVGRVTGMPYNQVDQICKLVPNNPANPVSLADAIDQEPQLKKHMEQDPGVKRLFDIAMQLEGLYRHASTHAAGVVIGGQALENIVALYCDASNSMPATQFNLKYIEMTGLVKFDFLGLKTLTVIQNTIDLLAKRGIQISLAAIPFNDPKTMELLRRVEVVGVFQLESPGMRDVLRKLQPTRFEELADLVALYRPGPMDDIPRYLACKHGEEKVAYAHPLIENILKETFGVMVYQEQVMQIAQHLAGYSLGQADLLRRAMGKKIKEEMAAQRDIFIKGCEAQSQIPASAANQIFDQMAKFASYGFPKGHAAPYALISYQTAYLKANFPVEFLAALLSSELNNTDKLTLSREELNRLKIPLLPPDINKSYPDFHVEEAEEGKLAVRYALAAIKNIGKIPMEAVVTERHKNGPFQSVFDFVHRLDPKHSNKRMLENLIAAGAFDALEPNRARLMSAVDLINARTGELLKLQKSMQKSLFADTPEDLLFTPQLADVHAWSSLEKSQREFEAIGFYLSEHPLDAYHEILSKHHVVQYRVLFDRYLGSDGTPVNLAGVVLSTKERMSKSGQKYAFVQFSDTSGVFEGVVFSDLYAEHRDLLAAGNVLFLKATARQEEETIRLAIHSLQKLDQVISQATTEMAITLKGREAVSGLYDLLALTNKGGTKVMIEFKDQHFTCCVELQDRYQVTPATLECLNVLPMIESVELH
jgi:DNA polymerase-3 subunit alpha